MPNRSNAEAPNFISLPRLRYKRDRLALLLQRFAVAVPAAVAATVAVAVAVVAVVAAFIAVVVDTVVAPAESLPAAVVFCSFEKRGYRFLWLWLRLVAAILLLLCCCCCCCTVASATLCCG